MKFSEAWLREWVDPEEVIQVLGNRLTMAGLELDSISTAAPSFGGVVVARIVALSQHPHAERLRICQVDHGAGEPVQVVCGAENVAVGMLAPFARVGAVLPGGHGISTSKLRGVESFGMLCSSKELGLSESATGLMRLEDDGVPGTDIRDYLTLDDAVLELDLTPNRADCLSIAGIAREVSTLTGAVLRQVPISPIPASHKKALDVRIAATEACPRYAGRVISGINPRASTPLWMRERLRRSGIRSIAPVVDVTNYVMLELGQPMHAFDLDKLNVGIQVRFADKGEKLLLLDGQELILDEDTLLIADHRQALALAGIMGGLTSAVSETTRDVFLESAYFSPQIIAGKARRFGLYTDSSHRFERGVDPQLQARAIERATALLIDVVGGKPGPLNDILYREQLPEPPLIALRASRIQRLLGISPESTEIYRLLKALGCEAQDTDEGWRVKPPSFRFDLTVEADLVEEVARVYGYDRIPATIQAHKAQIKHRNESKVSIDRIRLLLVDRGFQEAITYSFVDPTWDKIFNPAQEAKRLANPISSEMAVMRTTLWPGLVKAAQRNINRQQTRVRLFETGLRFVETADGVEQISMLACLASGAVFPMQWGSEPRAVDFFDIKSDLEALLELAGLRGSVSFQAHTHPALHPGQCAALFKQDSLIGWLGALHPRIERKLGLGQRIYLLAVELEVLSRRPLPHFKPLSRYPAIRRDVAVVVEEGVSADTVLRCIAAQGIEILQEIQIFDIYLGKGVPQGQKSLALGLILQDFSRTLKDKEIDAVVTRIVSGLKRELGASLRD